MEAPLVETAKATAAVVESAEERVGFMVGTTEGALDCDQEKSGDRGEKCGKESVETSVKKRRNMSNRSTGR